MVEQTSVKILTFYREQSSIQTYNPEVREKYRLFTILKINACSAGRQTTVRCLKQKEHLSFASGFIGNIDLYISLEFTYR